jgi:hypothetical protein
MEAVFAVSLVVGVVIWLFVRDPKGPSGPGARARPEPAAPGLGVHPPTARSAVQPLPAAPSHDDAAFFDGYVWGRLQERHDQRQHDPGRTGGHDHDMFDVDGDDGYDDG